MAHKFEIYKDKADEFQVQYRHIVLDRGLQQQSLSEECNRIDQEKWP